MRNNSYLDYTAPVTHSLDYVAFPRPNDALHFFTYFLYWRKKILFETRFRVRPGLKLFVNWHFVEMFLTPICESDDFLSKWHHSGPIMKKVAYYLHPCRLYLPITLRLLFAKVFVVIFVSPFLRIAFMFSCLSSHRP